MSLHDQLIASRQRGIFDDISTPPGVLSPLLTHIPDHLVIWETAPGEGKLVDELREREYEVEADIPFFPTTGGDPDYWDVIVTNPPYSQKREFLQYSDAYGKPWALLLPVTTLGVGKCQPYLRGSEIIFFPKRVDFTGGGAPWFAVAWFTKGLKIGKQLTFSE